MALPERHATILGIDYHCVRPAVTGLRLNGMGIDDRAGMMGTWYRPVLVIASVLLMALVVARSQLVAFTFDEVGAPVFAESFDWNRITESAAVHLLNALFTSWIKRAGFDSELAMRLPNTLSFVAYLVAAIDLGRGLKRPLALLQFVLLTLNPFLLDFFSLARGYGLGLAAMLPSIALAVRYLKTDRMSWCIASLLSGMLSVVANYAMLNFFIPLLLVLLMITGHNGRQRGIRATLVRGSIPASLALAFFAALLPVLLDLKEGGHFYFGGRWDLYSDTIASLGRCFGYHSRQSSAASMVFQVVFAWAILWSLWRTWTAVRARALAPASVMAGVLVLSLLSALSQFVLMGTPYPVERTALLYCPLVALCAAHGLAECSWRWTRVPALLTGSAFVLHFATTVNFDSTYSWRFDSGSREVVDLVRERYPGRVRLGICYEYAPAIWHYRGIHHYDDLMVTNLSECWEYCVGLEELDPRYYGQRCKRSGMDGDAVREFLRPGEFDLYYLDLFFLDAMDRSGVRYEVLLRHDRSRSALVRLTGPVLVQRTPLPLAITSEGRTNTSLPTASSAINTIP